MLEALVPRAVVVSIKNAVYRTTTTTTNGNICESVGGRHVAIHPKCSLFTGSRTTVRLASRAITVHFHDLNSGVLVHVILWC